MKKVLFYIIVISMMMIGFGYTKPVSALYIAAPSNVSVTYISDTSIKLNYKTNNTNSNYKVQIFNSTLGKLYTTEVNTSSYAVTGLDFGKTYNFLIRVYYKTSTATYKSNWTNTVSATPKAVAPVINSITSGDKSVTLNYKVTGSPKGVQIYNSNTKKVIDTTNLSTYKVTGLTNGTTYKFLIRNYYGNNVYGPWSTIKSGTPKGSGSSSSSSHLTITKSALTLAWPYGSGKKHTWSKGRPTDAYKKALNKVYPTHNKWGKCPKKGASCDVFVGTVIRNSGYDKSFPRGLSGQFPYLKKQTKKWQHIKYTGNQSQLQSGDVIAYDYKGNGAHILVYVKKNGKGYMAEAGYCNSYGRLTKYRKIVAGGKNIWVRAYRAVDASYR